jgi:outer membrane receptor protein involved in Fe transport
VAGVQSWLIGLAVASVPALALAQTAPPTATVQKPPLPDKLQASKTVEEVTVTAGAPEIQTSIDRQSFALGKDLQATTGSIADALRNLPAVEVDLQGNLSMRGDANVTILVDGKPAPQFQGAGRADALQQLGADQFERVEVMTNPSAALNPEGSGGVINLISKKSRGSGATGSTYVTFASAGTKRVGASFGYNSPKLSMTGAFSENYDRNKGRIADIRTSADPLTGAVTSNETDTISRNLNRTSAERLNLAYSLTAKDQLTANLQFSQMLLGGHPFTHFAETGPTGSLLGIQNRQGSRRVTRDNSSVAGGWKHSFSDDGHELTIDLLHNENPYTDHILWQTFQSLPPTTYAFERIFDDADQKHSELTVGYSRPLPGHATLKVGYELKRDNDEFRYRDFRGNDASIQPEITSLANRFLFKQTVNDAYATYERTLGDLSLQAGLRFEDVHIAFDQRTSDEVGRQDYQKLYPTLHLSYRLNEERKVTASFSERVNRPDSVLLNPLPYVIDPQNLQRGNPDLKPEVNQSFELALEDKPSGGGTYLATLYYRRREREVSNVLIDLGGGVLEQTYGNLGSSRTAGLELVANGKLTPKLSYSASTNIQWKTINAQNLGFAGDRSGFGVSARWNMNWQVRTDDLAQLNVIGYGRRLEPQGADLPYWVTNLGWRHKLGDRITATVTAQDIFGASHVRKRLDVERFDYWPVARAAFLRLDYRLGGRSKSAREPGFEYEGQTAPQ